MLTDEATLAASGTDRVESAAVSPPSNRSVAYSKRVRDLLECHQPTPVMLHWQMMPFGMPDAYRLRS